MIEQDVLVNGIRLLHKRVKSKKVSFSVFVECGSVNESHEKNGISHFLEHLIFKDGRLELRARPRYKLQRLGFDCSNCSTAFQFTEFNISGSVKYWRKALKLLITAVAKPLFTESDVREERQVIFREIRDEADNIYDLVQKLIFAKTPFGMPLLGTKKVLNTLTARKIRNWHKRLYQPERIFLISVGDMSIQEVQRVVNSSDFRDLKNSTINKKPILIKSIDWNARYTLGIMPYHYFFLVFPISYEANSYEFYLSNLLYYIFGDFSDIFHLFRLQRRMGLYNDGIVINEIEDVMFNSVYQNFQLSIFSLSRKDLKKLKQGFFAWMYRISERGISEDFFRRLYEINKLKIECGKDNVDFWSRILIRLIEQRSLETLHYHLDPNAFSKKAFDKVIRDCLGGDYILLETE